MNLLILGGTGFHRYPSSALRAHAVQFIDVRDVAEWSVRAAEAKLTGNFNAKEPAYPLTVGTMLDTLRDVVGNDAEFCEASTEFRNEQKVHMGSDLPVWIPR